MRLTQKRNGKNVIPLVMAVCGINMPYWRVDKADDLHSYLSGDAADKLAAYEDAEELSKPRWIPVTEQLPQEWWPVLGLIQYHDEKEPPSQQVLWYLGNGHWRETWRGDMIESDVTHWMPLPEPTKEET